ncbi:MAG: hypothetical protein M3065_00635 [Actinomycetota bacterium]|nr:hypothetical protein [Actinomycetota bacterium]
MALRAQLAEMRAYRQDVLATVHWALGIAGAVSFLLVGYSWFTNSRNYDRDQANMRAALRNEIDADFRKLNDELDAARRSHAAEIGVELPR